LGKTLKTRVQEEILVIPGKVLPALDFNAYPYCSAELNPGG
jgi:hypothetical protein